MEQGGQCGTLGGSYWKCFLLSPPMCESPFAKLLEGSFQQGRAPQRTQQRLKDQWQMDGKWTLASLCPNYLRNDLRDQRFMSAYGFRAVLVLQGRDAGAVASFMIGRCVCRGCSHHSRLGSREQGNNQGSDVLQRPTSSYLHLSAGPHLLDITPALYRELRDRHERAGVPFRFSLNKGHLIIGERLQLGGNRKYQFLLVV